MRIIATFCALAFLFTACEVVEGPYKNTAGNTNFCSPGDTIRKVLLEDFTGQGCINCPDAAARAEEIKDLYGKCVVLMAVHVGFFARPTPETPADFRTSIGNEWDQFFQLSPVGLPQGMINRDGFSSNHIIAFENWSSVSDQQIQLPPDALLSIDGTYNSSSLSLDVSTNTTMLNSYNGTLMLGVYLVEDGIISPQKWQKPDGSTVTIEDYEHNHVLRAGFNGTWGDTLSTGLANAGQAFTNNYQMAIDTSAWNPENLSIVAFVYDADSKEVIQAEAAHP